jgi:tripartite-type tricarboxylate transporter receptor subunit TctC
MVHLFAPKGIPEDIVARLNAAMVKSLSEPAVRAKFAELGLDITSLDQQAPDYLAKLHGDAIEKW